MKKFLIITIAVFLLIGLGFSPFQSLLDQYARERFSKITESKQPLTIDQVTALMGQPTSIEMAEATGISGKVYRYNLSHSHHDMNIVFVNGLVFRTNYVPEGYKS